MLLEDWVLCFKVESTPEIAPFNEVHKFGNDLRCK